jgi:hypothetical protein
MGEEVEGIPRKLRPEPRRGITSRRAGDDMHGDDSYRWHRLGVENAGASWSEMIPIRR